MTSKVVGIVDSSRTPFPLEEVVVSNRIVSSRFKRSMILVVLETVWK